MTLSDGLLFLFLSVTISITGTLIVLLIYNNAEKRKVILEKKKKEDEIINF